VEEFSTSQVETYVRCPLQELIRFHYKVPWKEPRSDAFAVSVREGILEFLRALKKEKTYRTDLALSGMKRSLETSGLRARRAAETAAQATLVVKDFIDKQWRKSNQVVAVNHPYRFQLETDLAITGTMDAIIIKNDRNPKKRVIELLHLSTLSRLPSLMEQANSISVLLNRYVLADVVISSKRRNTPVKSWWYCCANSTSLDGTPDAPTMQRARGWIRSILECIQHDLRYPRFSSCKTCNYRPVCDPRLLSKAWKVIPEKTRYDLEARLNATTPVRPDLSC